MSVAHACVLFEYFYTTELCVCVCVGAMLITGGPSVLKVKGRVVYLKVKGRVVYLKVKGRVVYLKPYAMLCYAMLCYAALASAVCGTRPPHIYLGLVDV